MKVLPTLLTTVLCATLLTACNKTEAPKTDTKPAETTKTEAPAEAPKTADATAQPVAAAEAGVSPTVQMYVDTMKLTTVMQLSAVQALTPEQKTCLNSNDANATYLETAKTEMLKALGEDGLKASDEFYATEVGKKFVKFTQQQLQQMAGQPIEGEAVTITPEDQAKIAEFSQSDAGKKIEASNTQADPQALMKTMEGFVAAEKTRCNIS